MNNACFVIFVNFAAALGIVFANKWLFRSIHFPPVTLMAFHFLSTFIILLCLRVFGIFKVKKIGLCRILPLSLTFCGSMVLTNLSLQHNTIGTYQVLKCLADPLFVIIQSFFYKKHYSIGVKCTLIPMIMGITLNSWFDLRYSQIGTLYALSAVGITAVYTVWVGAKQEEFNMSSMQILYYQSPLSFVLLLLLMPIYETYSSQIDLLRRFSNIQLLVFIFSGIAAFTVNLTTYWIIKNTSVITYAAFGKVKLCTTILIGFLLFGDPLQSYQMFGILLTLLGVSVYSYLKLKSSTNETELPS